MLKPTEANVMIELKQESVRICKQKIVTIRSAVEAAVYGVHIINAAKHKQFQVHLDHTEIEDGRLITDNLEREIYGITSAQPHHFNRTFSKQMVESETLWEQHGIRTL
jgi:hypothetical protein